MFTVKATIKCYRCDVTAEVDCEVESISIGARGNSSDGFVVKMPDEPEGWAQLTESYYYGNREDATHFYCPQHIDAEAWKAAKKGLFKFIRSQIEGEQ